MRETIKSVTIVLNQLRFWSSAAVPRPRLPALQRRAARTGLLVLCWCVTWATPHAAEFDLGPVLVLTEENDFVQGKDRWYTQGAKISYFQADNHLPGWSQHLFELVPTLGYSTGAERIGYQLGQSMFTPADTHTAEYLPDDRPYAGWLYTGLMYQRRGVGWGDYLTLENFQLDIGIVGPDSLAEQMQTWYHTHTPPGWSHQIGDEPGFALKYGRGWLIPLPSAERRYLDVVPQAGVSAGTIDSSFRAGTVLRAGWNLPEDLGPQPIESVIATAGGRSRSQGGRWGFYVFSGVEGRAVLYNEFLDGPVFRTGPNIDKEPFVGEWRSGLVLTFDRVELAYTHVFRTREFEGQPEGQVYGSFSVRVNF